MISAGEEKCYNLADDTTIPLWSLVSMVLSVLSSSPPIHSSLSCSFRDSTGTNWRPWECHHHRTSALPHGVYRLVGEVDIKHMLPQMSFYHCDKSMKVQYRVTMKMHNRQVWLSLHSHERFS